MLKIPLSRRWASHRWHAPYSHRVGDGCTSDRITPPYIENMLLLQGILLKPC